MLCFKALFQVLVDNSLRPFNSLVDMLSGEKLHNITLNLNERAKIDRRKEPILCLELSLTRKYCLIISLQYIGNVQ